MSEVSRSHLSDRVVHHGRDMDGLSTCADVVAENKRYDRLHHAAGKVKIVD